MGKAWQKARGERARVADGRRAAGLPPLPQVRPQVEPEKDPEFRDLPKDRQTWIKTRWDHMQEMDMVENRKAKAREIAAGYEGMTGAHSKGHGFSQVSLMRLHRQWRQAGRDWRTLDRYRGLIKRRVDTADTYNITTDSARAFLTRRGETFDSWSARYGFSASTVSKVLKGHLKIGPAQAIFDTMAREMREEPAVLHAELAKIRNVHQQQERRIEELFARLPPV